jgi:hypothetical protein
MRTATPLAFALALVITAPALSAQESGDMLAGLRNGGGWVSIPIVGGQGSMSTAQLPTMGMTLAGCMTVWPGHSGDFEILARETMVDTTLVVHARPGVGVPFRHTFGVKAQLDFSFRWSEARDTTLMLWLGLAVGRTQHEACEPVYAGR